MYMLLHSVALYAIPLPYIIAFDNYSDNNNLVSSQCFMYKTFSRKKGKNSRRIISRSFKCINPAIEILVHKELIHIYLQLLLLK